VTKRAASRGRRPVHTSWSAGPNLTDADIGGVRGEQVFINRVGPDGIMIVPLSETERAAIAAESQSLVEQVERTIGFQVQR